MQDFCTHQRTEVIARRGGVDYVRCRDCGQVFDAEDVEALSSTGETGEEDEDV